VVNARRNAGFACPHPTRTSETSNSASSRACADRIETVHLPSAPGPPLPDQQLITHDYDLFGSIAVEITDAVSPLGQGESSCEVQRRF
jgi:hypothetical protein